MSKYRIFDGDKMVYQDLPSSEFPCMKDTGQKDIAGQTIYECDILECGVSRGVVEWDEYSLCFSLRVGGKLRTLGDVSGCDVVGNAFQHGGLL
jgi:hypothetical protein